LKAVRKAIEYLRGRFQTDHPLLSNQMLTDGRDLFINHYGKLVSITEDGQLAMREIMDIYLKRILWDKSGMPFRLFPFTRGSYRESPQIISIDPKIRFGKPCISGTRIPTAIVSERHQAGDSIEFLAKDYGRDEQDIEEVIRYEGPYEGRIAS
jgi:uncharacterized protein (DUF433 family)